MQRIKRFPATVTIIILNILIFLITDFQGTQYTNLPSAIRAGGMYPLLVTANHEYYRLFTSMFLHFNIEHLLNNMLVLGAFGERVESTVGTWRFLILYLLGGLGGSLTSFAWQNYTQSYAFSAGASGAVFAIIGAMLYIVVYHRGRFQGISVQRLLIMLVLSLYLGITSGGVDNAAHLGGLLAGFVLAAILYHGYRGARRQRRSF